MNGQSTLYPCLRAAALSAPDAPAVLSPGSEPLTFSELVRQLDHVRAALGAAGIRRGDRVVLALPNGPELAVCFLGVAACTACAPLDPGHTQTEFERYLRELRATALITSIDESAAARRAAERTGTAVLELRSRRGAPAGAFSLGRGRAVRASLDDCAAADPALVLHTSGTTSRPRIVVLTHENIVSSARNIANWFGLGAGDRCLNVMPLSHVHGLLAGVLTPLISGGSTVCLRGFTQEAFFNALGGVRPTWYSAVPAVHRAVVTGAADHRDAVRNHCLRFIRSSSAPLPQALMADIEEAFRVPVVESYGMTETAHQITSNPLPPLARKPGTVGLPTGVDCAVVDEAGRFLPPDQVGEVVVRGATVVAGYEGDAAGASSPSFEGWFRTGDQGRFDPDGYLTLTGRLREFINRGGEKVNPFEVDQALTENADVADAACFAIPHPTMGEEIAAAVVLRQGAGIGEADLKNFAGKRLARYKVPRKIVFVDELPRGATGKLQRRRLTADLAHAASVARGGEGGAELSDAQTPLLATLTMLWRDVLGLQDLGAEDDFFLMGGDSLQAGRLVDLVNARFEVDLRPESLFNEAATVGGMAGVIAALPKTDNAEAIASFCRASHEREAPASYAQQSFWVMSKVFRRQPVFNTACAFRVRGRLKVATLEHALDLIVRRHEAMRTVLALRDDRLMQIVTQPPPLRLEQMELAGCTPEEREREAHDRMRMAAQRPFDLGQEPGVRMALFELGAQDRILEVVFHHAVADGWSRQILLDDLSAHLWSLVSGREPDVPALTLRFLDFASWQRRCWQLGTWRHDVAYWRGRLAGAAVRLSLARYGSRSEISGWQGRRQTMTLSAQATQPLRTVAAARRATLFMILLAAFKAMLHRETGETDIVVGVPFANRPVHMENVIGCFVNLLPLRTDLSGDPGFAELLGRVRDVCIGAYTHQHVPVEKLVGQILPEQQLGAQPLTPVLFQLRNYRTDGPREMHGLVIEDLEFDTGISSFELSVEWTVSPAGSACSFTYKTELLDDRRIADMMNAYRSLLETAAGDPTKKLSVS